MIKKIFFFISFLLLCKSPFAETKMFMLTDERCVYCIVWEKQIGKIYNNTEISKIFPLHRMYINQIDKIKKNKIFNTDITPTFVMYKNNVEIGRISGYSNPEMFWWQVDEIIDT